MARTLTVALAADIDGLRKGLKDAEKVVENSKDQIADFGKKAALAFAAAGAAAGAFAASAVKAAAADEVSRKRLEETIRSSTNATEAQIKSIDQYITKQSIATATTDDQIRPALTRLIRSTNDVTKAQELLNLSQEIAAATGKPLEAVTNAIAKSFDGSNASLGKLGLGLDATTLKTKSHDEIMQILAGTYKGFIENEGDNLEFKMRQIQIAFDETKEEIGYALLPIMKQFADYVLATVVPNIQALAAGLTGKDSVTSGVTNATKGAYEFGQQLKSTIGFVISIKDELIALGGIIATVFVANKIVAFVTAIGTLVTAMKTLRTAAAGAAVATAFATGGTSVGAAALALTAVAATYGLSQFATGADETGAGGSTFTYGTGNPQFGLPTGGTGFTGGGGGGGGGGFGGAGGGGGGGAGIGATATGATSLKNLADRLNDIQDQFADLTFLVASEGISKKAAQAQFDKLTAEFRVLERQAEKLSADAKVIGGTPFGQTGGNTTNIYVSGAVVDPEGLNRTLQDYATQSDARGTSFFDKFR
jgi:cell division protein FtsB